MKNKLDSIMFTCPICNVTNYFEKAKLVAHIDMEHSSLHKYDIEDVLCDFDIQLAQKGITFIEKELERLNKKKFKIYKQRVLKCLEEVNIARKCLSEIQLKGNLYDLKVYLMKELRPNYKKFLESAGIDCEVKIKKKKRKRIKREIVSKKRKHRKEENKKKEVSNFNNGEYYDKTINSVKVVYTPMGNRR